MTNHLWSWTHKLPKEDQSLKYQVLTFLRQNKWSEITKQLLDQTNALIDKITQKDIVINFAWIQSLYLYKQDCLEALSK